jgi:hypothetical protein
LNTEEAQRQRLSVDLGGLKPLVLRCARTEGKVAAVWVREVLEQAVQERLPEPVPMLSSTRDVVNRRGKGSKIKFGAYLTLVESETLRADAEVARLSQAEYVGRLVMGEHVSDRMQLLGALGELSQRLACIEQHLTIAARALKGHVDQADALSLVTQAAKDVRLQMTATAQVVTRLAMTRHGVARSRGGK